MKRYRNVAVIKKRINKVVCNGCGREIPLHSDYLAIDKTWGYGSEYDGERHCLDLCSDCYTRLIKGLKIPPEIK